MSVKWLTRVFQEHRPHTPLDLLAPALLGEIIIHVKPDGERLVYVSKTEATPQELMMLVQSVVEAGMDLARQYNIRIELKGGP